MIHLFQMVTTNEGNSFISIDFYKENLKTADVIVLTTNHSVFNIEFIQQHAGLIVDMRNMIRESKEKVYKL